MHNARPRARAGVYVYARIYIYIYTRHSPASKPRSPSSPLCLLSTSFGNLDLISSQRPWFTRVSDLVAVRTQEPTRSRHSGQLRLLCSNVPCRQRRQRLCVHGSVTGSIRMPRHIGHVRSRRCTSAVVRDTASSSFDARFKYIFPYPCDPRLRTAGSRLALRLTTRARPSGDTAWGHRCHPPFRTDKIVFLSIRRILFLT